MCRLVHHVRSGSGVNERRHQLRIAKTHDDYMLKKYERVLETVTVSIYKDRFLLCLTVKVLTLAFRN